MLSIKDIAAKTMAWATAQGYKLPEVTEKPEFSVKAVTIGDIINKNDFGCRREAIFALMDEITGEKIPRKPLHTSSPFRSGAAFTDVGIAVVPVNADNTGHAYALFKPYFVVETMKNGKAKLMDPETRTNGNYISVGEVRPATEAEITEAFDLITAPPAFLEVAA